MLGCSRRCLWALVGYPNWVSQVGCPFWVSKLGSPAMCPNRVPKRGAQGDPDAPGVVVGRGCPQARTPMGTFCGCCWGRAVLHADPRHNKAAHGGWGRCCGSVPTTLRWPREHAQGRGWGSAGSGMLGDLGLSVKGVAAAPAQPRGRAAAPAAPVGPPPAPAPGPIMVMLAPPTLSQPFGAAAGPAWAQGWDEGTPWMRVPRRGRSLGAEPRHHRPVSTASRLAEDPGDLGRGCPRCPRATPVPSSAPAAAPALGAEPPGAACGRFPGWL